MPWSIDSHHSDCAGFAVVKESDGSVAGCHDTRDQAERQLAALYAKEPAMAGAAASCSCSHPAPEETDPFGEALAASVLAAVREPNRAARRAMRAGNRARRALQAAAMEPLDAPFPVPAYPPREWFEGPPNWVEPWRAAAGLKSADDGGILRLTITDEGRIGGWFFNAGQCLVHDPAACPKHSPTRYAAFHQSDVLCADGTMLDVGVIGMTHGHQSPWLDWKEAQRLYADPTAQTILCCAGDDPRGGWIAGAVVPGVTYGDVAMMRRSGLSGDWRPMPQSWWADHGVSSHEVRQVEGYDCIGPTLVTRPALPLVRNFSVDGRAAAILGGSAGIELDVSRFSRRDRERITVLASADPEISRFTRRAYVEWNPEDHPRGEHGLFVHGGGGDVTDTVPGVPEPVHSKAAPGEFDTITADLREEAAILADRAAQVEPTVSQALQSLVPAGAVLAGFDFRLKGEDRMAEKLADAHAQGLDDEAALGEIGDALRYTVTDDPERYTGTTQQTIEQLQSAGFQLYKDPKNYWEKGDAYSGINTSWVTPEGVRFELQFHTPESLEVKERIHPDYKTYRSSTDPALRAQLWDSMVQEWEGVPIPPGIFEVGKLTRSTAMIAATSEPTHYYVTDRGKYFRRRRDETGQYLEILDPDGTWRDLPSLISYLTGNNDNYEELPGPPPGMQGSVSRFARLPSRFARRAYVEFDPEEHPRGERGRFTFKDEGGPYIEPDRSGEPGGVFDVPLTPETVGKFDFGQGDEAPSERVTPVTLPNRVSLYPDNVQALIDANPRMSGEDDFAYAGRIVQQLDAESQSDVIYALRETYDPAPVAADGLARWQEQNGLDPVPADVLTMRPDLDEADAVARFFEQTPDMSDDPEVRAAYDDFKQQNDRMYEYMTRPESEGGMGLTVEFTNETDPYPTAEAQANDITENRRIVIESGLGGDHTLMSQDEYDRFRAVHDVFGHAAIGGGFDRHGEYEAWLTHAAMYTDPGRQAMSSEYHGVNSAMWSGEPGTPGTGKAVLLPEPYGTPPWERDLAPAQPIAAAAAVPEATPPEVAELIRTLGLDADFAREFDHPAWHTEDAMQGAWRGPIGAKAKPDKRLPKVHMAASRFARRAYTFDESAHPRDERGKFTESDGGGGGGGNGGGSDDVTAAEAVSRFIKGEKVTVDPDEVATFTDRIGKFLAKEKAEGREAKLNLCEVSVPGTNLFCGDNQGYTRLEMPQLSGEPVPGSKADRLPKDKDGGVDITSAFTDRLAEMGVDITPDVVPSASLKATQSELRGDKSVGIAQAIRDGKIDIEGGDRIFVSNDGYILDGHHRWAGAILNDFEDGHLGDAKMPVARVDLPIRQLVDLANEFSQQMGVAAKGTTGPAASAIPRGAAATVRASQEVDMESRYIITFPDGRRADSISIGCRVASIPLVASVVAAGDLPVADAATPWDENTAKQNLLAAAGEDMDTYGRAFLFHDDTQEGPESYYWPIADVIDGQVTVVPAAVDAAMAAINDGTIGTLTPEEKDATVAILSTYSPVPEEDVDAALTDQVNAMQAELSAQRARVNAFDEFMDGYLRERTEAQIASIVAAEQPLPPFPAEAPLPVA